jgi:hypothetical protein
MLDDKLDFLPLEESLQLIENGIVLKTMFHHVCSTEEIGDEYEEPRDFVEAIKMVYGDNHIKIGNSYNHFDEFTYGICPAPTYIDLII